MALKKRSMKEDVIWLKLPIVMFCLAVAAAVGSYVFATYFWNDVLRRESASYSDFNYVSSQVFDIEEAEQIIVSNIDRFNEMVENQVMSEENRVSLLAEIGAIREKYKLFPLNVSISEQEKRVLDFPLSVESPEEQVSLRRSLLKIQLPLLHEEDLTRFLFDFTSPARLLVNNRCLITALPVSDDELLGVVPHQQAACDFHWYTLGSEPFVYEDYGYE